MTNKMIRLAVKNSRNWKAIRNEFNDKRMLQVSYGLLYNLIKIYLTTKWNWVMESGMTKEEKIDIIINDIKDIISLYEAGMITFEEFYAKYILYSIRLNKVDND